MQYKIQHKTTIRALMILMAILFNVNLRAQISLSTTSSFTNNNGSGTVTFNLQNTNSYPIIISDIKGVTGTSGNVAVEFYYKTTPVSGSPGAISAANGWNLISSGTITGIANTTTTVTQTFFSGLSFTVPANTTYGIAVFAAGQRYFTMSAGTTTLSAGGVNFIGGTNISYGGGTPPATPGNSPRGWIGEIIFSPALACAGTPTSGNAVSTTAYACSNTPFGLSLANDSIRTGLTYQWLSSSTGQPGTYIPMMNDTTRNISKSQTSSTYYRCVVACNNLSFDTSTAVFVRTTTGAVSGTFTIDRNSPVTSTNYHSLRTLETELECVGISGPLTINIVSDTTEFEEQVVFNNIPGTSSTNQVLIKGNRNTFTSNFTPIFQFVGSKYITIDSLRIIGGPSFTGIAVDIEGASQYITITNSEINAGTTTTSTANAAITVAGAASTTAGNNGQYITITNNTIIGGYYGVNLVGNTGYADNYGHLVQNNTIQDFYLYGVYMVNADSVQVIGNDINRLTRQVISTFYGIYQSSCRYIKVHANNIHDAGSGTYTAYPIYTTTSVNSPGFESEYVNNTIIILTLQEPVTKFIA